ncbi:Phox-like protein [Saitoella complicata NRRL Y-17804]|nr:Phox-like protein [Saitoella complicata NRRL Y-17804]ODQ50873.1 Phox-like protein [Saitoella complicata NRRL Y-17804]
MSLPLQISIPSASTATDPKPHTVYKVSVSLGLRSLNLQKRYSDFVTLNTQLKDVTGSAPPTPLPPKHYFKTTISDTGLREERRRGLEAYLRAIANSPDPRWRECPAWRTFLKLPTTATATPSDRALMTEDWLTTHKTTLQLLHSARTSLFARDRLHSTEDIAQSHSASAEAKKALVDAARRIGVLEGGLKKAGEDGIIGEGELRRRRDLVADARKELGALEELTSAVATRRRTEEQQSRAATPASIQQQQLFNTTGTTRSIGRTLGGPAPETERTRELSNTGLLQLQQTMMEDQDDTLETFSRLLRKQMEIGVAIGEELDEQNEMLDEIDGGVDRLGRKVKKARKGVEKLNK